MITYAIGDVHGRLDLLKKAFAHIRAETGQQEHRVVLLGDYIDRGPENRGVLDLLMGGPLQINQELVCLAGNHDWLMLAALRYRNEQAENVWLNNGGLVTLEEYRLPNKRLDTAALNKAMNWIEKLPRIAQDEFRIFVHAGLDPEILSLDDPEQRENMLWYRQPNGGSVPDYQLVFGKQVVHGHTPLKTALVCHDCVNLDTGAVFGNGLSLARWNYGEIIPKITTFR